MRKVWIVVANSALSKIYAAETVHHLTELQTFEHKETHDHVHDVMEKDGKQPHKMGYGSNSYQSPTPYKTKEASHFAEEIAHFLEEACVAGKCERIYLTAAPEFLGHLRGVLGIRTSKCIAAQIPKDLTHLNAADILSHLPPAL